MFLTRETFQLLGSAPARVDKQITYLKSTVRSAPSYSSFLLGLAQFPIFVRYIFFVFFSVVKLTKVVSCRLFLLRLFFLLSISIECLIALIQG